MGLLWQTLQDAAAQLAARLPVPLAEQLAAHAESAALALGPAIPHALPAALSSLPSTVNAALAPFEPWEVALLSALALALLLAVLGVLRSAYTRLSLQAAFALLRSLPPISFFIAKEKAKLRRSLLASRQEATGPQFLALPDQGMPQSQVLGMLRERAACDVKPEPGLSKLSGALYIGSDMHRQVLDSAYSMFSLSNPLHADVWPSVRQMEAEVVQMTAALLGGGPACPSVCGAMTSGGTESILSAMKASRDYMCQKKGIKQPEMILAKSAHAAYWKACEYFKIKPVVVQVGRDFRLSAATVRRHLNANTVVVVASAPGFPHGIVDHVQELSALARRWGVCLHVDACLGGFVLPFARHLGYPVPAFDFSLPGVTSMSVDTHKFGMAHKGTSVVLYRHPDIRKHQFTGITDWTGGLYISPGMAGSRPGALIATAWTSLVHTGMSGYLQATKTMMEVSALFQAGVQQRLPELRLVGQPDMCVVAFMAHNPKVLNIYKVNDLLTRRGWHLNALQSPPALHFCFTAAHSPAVVEQLLLDLEQTVATVLRDPSSVSGGSAPMYGMANAVPDRGMIAEFLTAYQDVMLEP